MSWNNSGNPGFGEQSEYGYNEGHSGYPQGLYFEQINGNQVGYCVEAAFYPNQSGYTWYNPQYVQGYQQQDMIPSYAANMTSVNEGDSGLNQDAGGSSSGQREMRYRQPPGIPTSRFPPQNRSNYKSNSTGKTPQSLNPEEMDLNRPNPADGNSFQEPSDLNRRNKFPNNQRSSNQRNNPSNNRGGAMDLNSGDYGGSSMNMESGGRSYNRQRQGDGGRRNQGRNQTQLGGNSRTYRNPNSYYGTTQYPHRSDNTDDRGVQPECSKTQDRKRLLAEVATLLKQDKGQGKASSSTSSSSSSRNRGNTSSNYRDKDRGWAATPNTQPQNAKFSSKKDFRQNEFLTKDSSRREPETQRERLIDQLINGTLECLVCCERLKQWSTVWSCENCYHILHLNCVSKWALTSTTKVEGVRTRVGTSWRCPACQFTYDSIPDNYTCFCTKLSQPKWAKGETPHCCGETCGKSRKSCNHPCTLLCHPGPCPPCGATVTRQCGCGLTAQAVLCSSTLTIQCENICGKKLSCGHHDCLAKCHHGPCEPCPLKLTIECHCGQEKKEVECGWNGDVSCGQECARELECGNHKCSRICHAGSCGPCPSDPVKVTTCHCGAKQMIRKSCSEEVKSCGGVCKKIRSACRHPCSETCHPGACPPCSVIVSSSCRCGHTPNIETPCYNLSTLGEKPLCKKKCTKKRWCKRHKCNQECCNDVLHTCLLPCNKNLSCGQHRCESLCHLGNCHPCTRLSFEELRCECGFSVIYPPVECGTRPPECTQPCTRRHDCDHVPTHSCHSLPQCPPCTVLVSRTCYGGHETRKAVACYIAEYSCGIPCAKPLPCNHRCVERCHGGPCPSVCKQACPTPREVCGHPCSLPCHVGSPCTGQAPCSAPIDISCQCARRKQTVTCAEFRKTWARHQTVALAANQTREQVLVDPTKISSKVLDCDDECKLQERNMRLAIGLQIANPDLSNKLKPAYSETMRQWAKRDPRLCDMVHSKLTNLVQLAKESKQKSRSYSFEVMSSVKRQFVHEYCKHFGCDSVAYDAEPKRNVVATAYRDRCWLPSYSLMEVIQRESGQRKVPVPSLRKPLPSGSTSFFSQSGTREAVQLPIKGNSSQGTPSQLDRPPSPHIDYFDFTPTS